jgi:hypothetical protein
LITRFSEWEEEEGPGEEKEWGEEEGWEEEEW